MKATPKVAADRAFLWIQPWPARAFLCLAVLAAYASVWPNQFVFDDIGLIVSNTFLPWKSFSFFMRAMSNVAWIKQAGMFYRPVPLTLHFLVFQLFGLSTTAYHALNIAIHALNACLLFELGCRLGLRRGAVFAAALLWALHPLFSDAVAFMSATPEMLWGTFCLAGLLALLPDFSPRRIGIALAFFLLALGSKGSAAIFPALAMIVLFFVSEEKDRLNPAAYLRTWPLWLLALCYVGGWMWFVHATGYTIEKNVTSAYHENYSANMLNRFFTSLATLPVYARLVLWPRGMHIEWVFPVSTSLLRALPLTGALMIGLAAAQVIWGQARRGLALSFGLLWFGAAFFPVSGILFPLNTQFSENWIYMPMMGLALGVAETVAGFLENRRQLAQGLVCVLALALGTATFVQSRTWLNTETFYNNVVKNGGDPYRIVPLLGAYYLEQGQFDKALEFTRYELGHPTRHTTPDSIAQLHMQQALAWLHVQPDEDGNVSSLQDIERFVSKAPRIPEAIHELGQALAADPQSITAHQYLVVIYRQQGNKAMAELHEKRLRELLQGV